MTEEQATEGSSWVMAGADLGSYDMFKRGGHTLVYSEGIALADGILDQRCHSWYGLSGLLQWQSDLTLAFLS